MTINFPIVLLVASSLLFVFLSVALSLYKKWLTVSADPENQKQLDSYQEEVVEVLPKLPNLSLRDCQDLWAELQAPHPRLIILDVVFKGELLTEVIPGARPFDMNLVEHGEYEPDGVTPLRKRDNFNMRSPRQVRAILERMGINVLSRVVIYSQYGQNELICCSRVAWMLYYAGVKHISLLNGGMITWRHAGLPVDLPLVVDSPSDFFLGVCHPAARFPLHPEVLCTTEQIRDSLNNIHPEEKNAETQLVLADVRSLEEHRGGRHQYPWNLALGRIPSARWARWGPQTYVGGDFWDHSGLFKSLEVLRSTWEQLGVIPANCEQPRIAFYCGSGWRSSLAWFLSRLLGLNNTMNYDGGFAEWTYTHPEAASHPICTGPSGQCCSHCPPLPPQFLNE